MVADGSVVLGFSVIAFALAWFIQGMYIRFLARRSDLGITFNSSLFIVLFICFYSKIIHRPTRDNFVVVMFLFLFFYMYFS